MSSQEDFWKGDFGNAYHQRNPTTDRMGFWLEALQGIVSEVTSVFEPGAGRGDNLASLRIMNPTGRFTGMEINAQACELMRKRGLNVLEGAFNELKVMTKHDLVITRGFLIHVPDAALDATLYRIHAIATKYICLAEYYSPERRQVAYRGYENALWLDDFALQMLKTYPDLKLKKYGFMYHLDGGHDLTYFLMEKVK
jgi:pseudaminic acid biosynthesis-associated methylase